MTILYLLSVSKKYERDIFKKKKSNFKSHAKMQKKKIYKERK